MTEPEYYVGSSTDVNGFEGLLVANERIVSRQSVLQGIDNSAMKFKMADVFWDRDCPSGTMYVLRYDNPKLVVQSGHWFKVYPAVDPANQLLEVYKLESILQVISGNPRHLGVITVIT